MLSTSHRAGMLGAFKTARPASWPATASRSTRSCRAGSPPTGSLTSTARCEQAEKVAREQLPIGRLGTIEEIGAAGGVPLLRARELHHRPGAARSTAG